MVGFIEFPLSLRGAVGRDASGRDQATTKQSHLRLLTRDCHAPSALAMTLIVPIPLFFPRIAEIVIAGRFPKTGLVLFHQANAAHPLGALPKIQMWYEHTCRTAMLRSERFIVIFQGDKGL